MTIRRSLTAAVLALGLVAGPALAQAPGYQPPAAAPAGTPAVLKIKQGTLKGSSANGVDYFYAVRSRRRRWATCAGARPARRRRGPASATRPRRRPAARTRRTAST
jgi:hypothetical protein